MIYKLQRLFSDEGKKDNPQPSQKNAGTNNPRVEAVEYKTADEAIAAAKKERLEGYKKLAGNTAYIDEKTGERITAETIDNKCNTKIKNAETRKRLEKEAARKERVDKAKQKVKNAANKTKAWAKKNKKGLIIGGSILAGGTGATIIGSKINKKNKKNKIKEDVRGY